MTASPRRPNRKGLRYRSVTGMGKQREQSDPKAWKIVDQDGNRVYNQFQQSKVETPVRSPFDRSSPWVKILRRQ